MLIPREGGGAAGYLPVEVQSAPRTIAGAFVLLLLLAEAGAAPPRALSHSQLLLPMLGPDSKGA